jgi:hypothetical protein
VLLLGRYILLSRIRIASDCNEVICSLSEEFSWDDSGDQGKINGAWPDYLDLQFLVILAPTISNPYEF